MTLDLASILQGHVFAFLLIFCRVGSILMLMPGVGETFVPARLRLQFALFISFILLPFLAPGLPHMPSSVAKTVELVILEFGYGIFMGLIMRLMLSTLEMAGQLISMQTGLSNAMIFNPSMASQGSLPGALMTLLGVLIIFESGLLDLLFGSLVQSYNVFKPGAPWPVADFNNFMTGAMMGSLDLALRLVAPFMILGIVFQLAAGVMVKMVPQIQIFFVAAPLQILLGMVIFAGTIAAIMAFWADGFEAMLTKMIGG